jgi:hypothetical protein
MEGEHEVVALSGGCRVAHGGAMGGSRGVEPKAHSGGPFPLGFGPTWSTKHGVLTSGTRGRRRAVRRRVRQQGFFLELRH